MSEPKKREMGERMMRLVDAIERLRGMPIVLVIGEKIVFLGSLGMGQISYSTHLVVVIVVDRGAV